jgi:hypothetical protein
VNIRRKRNVDTLCQSDLLTGAFIKATIEIKRSQDSTTKTQYPDPTVPPPPAAHSKPPACINHYCPQAIKKFLETHLKRWTWI